MHREGGAIQAYNNVEEEDKVEAASEMSELDDTVTLGDVVLVKGLASAQGLELNGYYGKVVAERRDGRWGVRIKDRTYALKETNLGMGMKAEEMSEEDEELLLSLDV